MTRIRHKHRRKFLGSLNRTPFGELLDLDFDNDNDEPVTAEHLDWCQSRKSTRLT